jgi:hypothetical protein
VQGTHEIEAWASQRFKTDHSIDFNNTTILEMATGYMDHIIKEAIKIRLHLNNFSRDLDFTLSQSWHPLTNFIKRCTNTPIQRMAKSKQASDSSH